MAEKKVPTEIYSRVVGYFRPVSQWNKGKKEEFKERKEFDVTNEKKSPSITKKIEEIIREV